MMDDERDETVPRQVVEVIRPNGRRLVVRVPLPHRVHVHLDSSIQTDEPVLRDHLIRDHGVGAWPDEDAAAVHADLHIAIGSPISPS